ncbi:hypothetical protein Q9233_002824 [Columba guinea]|nr:hypothetical protein Q9233_002824 [Columba guinea]
MAKAAGVVYALLLLAALCCQSLAQKSPWPPWEGCDGSFRVKSGKEICAQASRPWVKRYQQSFQVSSFSIPS